MHAGAFLDDRNGAPHLSRRFEVAQQDDRVGEIGDVDRRIHRADDAVLRDRHEGARAAPVEVLQQLMHMQDERVFLRHGRAIAVDAVDDDLGNAVRIDQLARAVCELARRDLRRVDLLDEEESILDELFEIHVERVGTVEQEIDFLVEREHRNPLPALHRSDGEAEGDERFARPRRTQYQRARTFLDAPAEQRIERPIPGREFRALVARVVFEGDQARIHVHAAALDDEVVVSAAVMLRAIFGNPQAPTSRAVVGRDLLESDHAVRNAVHGLVARLAGQIVEEKDRDVLS